MENILHLGHQALLFCKNRYLREMRDSLQPAKSGKSIFKTKNIFWNKISVNDKSDELSRLKVFVSQLGIRSHKVLKPWKHFHHD